MSHRNNEDRLGARAQDDASPIQQEESSQAFNFNFSTPTEFIELPTKGKFYPEGHPLHNEEHIEIRYMTAKEEDILTSKSLLKKGVAIDRFLQSLIVDKRIKVDELYVGDKNALVVGSRITGYGADYQTTLKCSNPACGASFDHTFDLNEVSVHTGSLPEGCTETDRGTFMVKLPKMDLRVEVKLLNGKDEKALSMMQEKRKKHKLPEANLTDQLRQFIVSVEGHREQEIINKLIENMPGIDSRHLRNVYKQIVPNVDFKKEVICEVCESEQELDVPFTADFFWPK